MRNSFTRAAVAAFIGLATLACAGAPAPTPTPAPAPAPTPAPTPAPAPARDPDIHFVGTPPEVVDVMLELAEVAKDDVVYDLGCGDGRINIIAAQRYGARGVGYEIDPALVALAQKNVEAAGVSHLVSIVEADVFTLDLSQATVVTLYLLRALNTRLIPQLQQLAPGSRIVSHDFDMEGVTPARSLQMHALNGSGTGTRLHRVYLWKTPLIVRP